MEAFPVTPGYGPRSGPIFINTCRISQSEGIQYAYPVPPHMVPPHLIPLPGLHLPIPPQYAMPPAFNANPQDTLPTPPEPDYSPSLPAQQSPSSHASVADHTIKHLALSHEVSPQSTVEVLVVSDGKCQTFPVHCKLLCSFSPYFRAVFAEKNLGALKTASVDSNMVRREWRWEDAKEVGSMDTDDGLKVDVDVVVKLPYKVSQHLIDPNQLGPVTRMVFATFLDWLYNGYAGFGLEPPVERKIGAATLIQVWVFAGKIGIPACQNDCVEGIEWWRNSTDMVQVAEVEWLYDNTEEFAPGECKLRKLLIDHCAWQLGGVSEVEESFPRAALVDLLGEMKALFRSGASITVHEPPFSSLEWRKASYYMPVEERVEEDTRELEEG